VADKTDKAVEAAARAIYELSPCMGFSNCEAHRECACRKKARAALEAALPLHQHPTRDEIARALYRAEFGPKGFPGPHSKFFAMADAVLALREAK